VAKSGQAAVFGRRKEPHTIIIARGDEIRHFTIRPWVAAFLGSALAAIAVGYLLATSYLVLRDDLIGAATARQARVQQAYEDRISALRAQVDRITSRQLLDQQLMETKVSELLHRQSQLTQRHGRLEPILDRATAAPQLPATVPAPTAKPEIRAGLTAAESPIDLAGMAPAAAKPFSFWSTRNASRPDETSADHRPGRPAVHRHQPVAAFDRDRAARPHHHARRQRLPDGGCDLGRAGIGRASGRWRFRQRWRRRAAGRGR
jgi:hypothetical protein